MNRITKEDLDEFADSALDTVYGAPITEVNDAFESVFKKETPLGYEPERIICWKIDPLGESDIDPFENADYFVKLIVFKHKDKNEKIISLVIQTFRYDADEMIGRFRIVPFVTVKNIDRVIDAINSGPVVPESQMDYDTRTINNENTKKNFL